MLEEMNEELYQDLVSKIKAQAELNAEAKRKEEEERKRLEELAQKQKEENASYSRTCLSNRNNGFDKEQQEHGCSQPHVVSSELHQAHIAVRFPFDLC